MAASSGVRWATFFDAASIFLNNDATVAEETAARPRLLPAMEMKSRRVRLRMTEFGLVMRWAAIRKERSEWNEGHRRQSREGSGDRGGSRGNQNRIACARVPIFANSLRSY